jgi:hypothetical protein
MVIRAMSQQSKLSLTQKDKLEEILNMKTNEQDLLVEAIDLLHRSGSITYS